MREQESCLPLLHHLSQMKGPDAGPGLKLFNKHPSRMMNTIELRLWAYDSNDLYMNWRVWTDQLSCKTFQN